MNIKETMVNSSTLVEKQNLGNTRKMLIDNIQKWVTMEKQLRTIHEQVKQIRESKNILTKEIYAQFRENNMNTNKIETNEGQLILFEKKEYSPLTYTYIEKCLCEIIPEKKQVDYIIHYLKSKREIKSSPDIRKIDKK